MTTWLARLRPVAIAMALPVGGIALAYTLLIDNPLRKQTTSVRAKLTKLADTVEGRSQNHAANLRNLELTVRAQRELSQLVSTTPKPNSATESSSAETSSIVAQVVNVDSPLSTLAATLNLLERHHLECLASEPGEESTVRRSVRFTLHGSFADMHSALEEMQSALSCVSIVSLEMEASLAGQTTHRWTLVLLV